MLSVIVPIFNEEENVPELHAELRGALEELGRPYEIIYVDDGSTDDSFARLKTVAQDPGVMVVQLRRNFGQTAALAAGADASSGEVLIFMDGDLQNDPADIPRLLQVMEEGDYDVVSGWRKHRQDAAIKRRLPSRIANWLISRVSGVRLNDYGCTLKAYRREVMQNLRLYGEMHRFIPAYAAWAGARIAELPVNHRARRFGQSKYGINRTIKVLLDLLTLKFLSSYSTKPIYLFGGLGALCFLSGGLSFLLVVYMKLFEDLNMNRNPVLLMCVFMFLAGLLFITQGLLAELVTRTYFESQDKPIYVVRAVLGLRLPRPSRARRLIGARVAPASRIRASSSSAPTPRARRVRQSETSPPAPTAPSLATAGPVGGRESGG
ncbi:MAG: glycosyltransferase family 2 protein [Chloroflexi bacterium]|nr:glycosyltransferase family 2 protein [Chloroflexota bacterium]